MALVRFNGNPNVMLPTVANLVDNFLGDISNRTGSDLYKTVPAVNIYETEENYQLEFAAPGLTKEDFSIHVDNKTLIISSEKQEKEAEQASVNYKYNRKEFNYNSFKRSFRLPEFVNIENISAQYENGILKVVVPKREEVKPRTIQVS